MEINKKDFVKTKVNIKITPGEMLKTLRELQELSQKELAEITVIPQSNISVMETNTRSIGRERAIIFS